MNGETIPARLGCKVYSNDCSPAKAARDTTRMTEEKV